MTAIEALLVLVGWAETVHGRAVRLRDCGRVARVSAARRRSQSRTTAIVKVARPGSWADWRLRLRDAAGKRRARGGTSHAVDFAGDTYRSLGGGGLEVADQGGRDGVGGHALPLSVVITIRGPVHPFVEVSGPVRSVPMAPTDHQPH